MSIPTTDAQMKSLIDQNTTNKTGQSKSIPPTMLGTLLKTMIDFCTSFFITKTEKGQADGVATLNTEGKVPATQLPANIGGTSISDNDFEVAIRQIMGFKTLFAGQKIPEFPENWNELTEEEQNTYLEDLIGKGVLFFQKFEQDFNEQVPVLDENNQPVLDENNNPTYTTNTVTKQLLLIVLGNYNNGFKIIKNITDNTYQFFYHGLPPLNLQEIQDGASLMTLNTNDTLGLINIETFYQLIKSKVGYHANIGLLTGSMINATNSMSFFLGGIPEGRWTDEIIVVSDGFNATELAKIQSVQLLMSMNNDNSIVSWDITTLLFSNMNFGVIKIGNQILLPNTGTNFTLEFTFTDNVNPQNFGSITIDIKAFRKEVIPQQ